MNKLPKTERLSKLLNKIRIRLDLKLGGLGDSYPSLEEINKNYPAYGRALHRLTFIKPKEDNRYYDSTDERYKVRRPDRVIRQGIKLYPSGGGFYLSKKTLGND